MRTTDVDVICTTYDEAVNKRKAIMSLAKLLGVSPEEIIEKLQQNGRTISAAEPKLRKKPEVKEPEAPKEETKESPKAAALPMPEYVQDILFKEFGTLERKIDDLSLELEKTKEHYIVLKNYLFGS